MAKTAKKSAALKKVAPASKPAIATGSPKLDRTLARAEVKAAAKPEPKKAPAKSKDREVIPGDARITVLVKQNPRRAGTLGARTFAAYRTGMTVGEWREKVAAADLDAGYLHADLRAGHIKVVAKETP